ncbi:adenylosuccinate synthase [Bacteroidetes bacterium endosymbiont of Geopemphigus sp.]|uniref:adenylosuccinate synthase n=1 Tax=Bacteroidetes bacterium endosymbiont of Geopemphigus sp. TaxID=2047937 RepID=UPI000CD32AE1|nr:adenylosuccinate synthase [Bacteroidetes bacterium endosymbiont of Geopemphigus sp.]
MFSSIIVGLQWGDEGKGKITDLLAEKSDYIIRYQGGNNAGHSLHINRESFVLHLIPSGVVHSGKKCLIASGVVVDPRALLEELGMLESRGLDTSGVFLANRAHITLPYHRLLDDYKEELRGARSIGTTRRGIGPTYEDQSARIGIRAIDLLDEKIFYEKLKINLEYKNRIIDCVYGKSPMDFQPIYEEYMGYADKLRPRIIDSVYEIHQALKSGKKLLFEGAQAILLDIAYGTYPYVTTSSPSTGGVCTGAGIPPTALKNFIGVTKAYCTRVGSGPFPTELKDSTAEELRDKGHEYGATTKRPRRCGWLDLVALRYACMINGINHLVMTKLDVLTGFERLRIAIAYEKTDHSRTDQFPASSEALEKMRPVYIDLPGWQENISRVTSYEALPENCKEYLRFIEKFMGIELDIISVGPERRQNIIKKLDLF